MQAQLAFLLYYSYVCLHATMVAQEPFHSLRTCLLCTEAGSAVDGHVMVFTRSAPSNADQDSFPCSSAHDSHDIDAKDDSCDVSAGRSLQAASDAASASLSGSSPQASSAPQAMQDLVHLQCWGAGFAGGSGFVHSYVHAYLCVCVPACGKQVLSSIVSKRS